MTDATPRPVSGAGSPDRSRRRGYFAFSLGALFCVVTGVCFYQAYRANQQLLKYYTPTPPIDYRPASTTYSFTDDDFIEPIDPRPATVRLQELIGAISAHIEELRSRGQVEPASKMQTELDRILAQREGPYPVDGKSQLHAIGIYDGGDPKDRANQIDGHAVGDAHVHVRYQGAPLVLGLCAYDPVRWIIKVDPGVQIKKVVVGGYYHQQIQGLPDGTPLEGQVHGGRDQQYTFYATTPVEAQAAGVRFRELTGLVPTTFYTTHEYRGSPFIVGPGGAEWTATMTLHALTSLYREAVRERRMKLAQQLVEHSFPDVACVAAGKHGGFATSFATHSIFGPYAADMQPLAQPTTQFAVDPRGPSFFGWSSRGIVTIDPKTGEVTPWPIAGIQASHFGAKLAFDTRRNRLLVWGQELWAVDILAKRADSLGRVNATHPFQMGVAGVAYSEEEDLIYTCCAPYDGDSSNVLISEIRAYNHRGAELTRTKLAIPIPGGEAKLAIVDGKLLIAHLGSYDGNHYLIPSDINYVVDPKTGELLFACRRKPR